MSGGTESSLSTVDMMGVASTDTSHAPSVAMPMMGIFCGRGRLIY